MFQSARYPDIRLTVKNLGCVRGDRAVFGGLGFDCGNGDAVRVTGPNGIGKSTLLRILAGFLPATVGGVLWTVDNDTASAAPPLAYCGHRDPVKPWLTVREHLEFWRRLNGVSRRDPAAVAKAAAAFGLTGMLEISGGWLSAGQKRRVALSRLLVAPAPLWLLDEPTVTLDSDGVGLFEAAVASHREAGGVAVIATHAAIHLPGAQALDLEAFAKPPVAA